MSKKTKSKKATPKTKGDASPETKAAKAPREKKDPDATKVFAFRLTPAESAAIHKTAGPRGASRFARAVLVAFANEDETAFGAVLKEAKEARQ
mgnify:CR=1 FL=1